MKFIESEYYNKELLGKHLYEIINNNDEIFTAQEYFNKNNVQKEYYEQDGSIIIKLHTILIKG